MQDNLQDSQHIHHSLSKNDTRAVENLTLILPNISNNSLMQGSNNG